MPRNYANKEEKALVEKLQKETLAHNLIAQMAHKNKRDYITPEDIGEALKTIPKDKVRLDVLEVLGNCSGFGAEDSKLCAWVAFKGEADE